MAETFYFDGFQIPATGVFAPNPYDPVTTIATVSGVVVDPDTFLGDPSLIKYDNSSGAEHVRTDVNVAFVRQSNMVISNFGALNTGARLSSDYTRTNTMVFKAKGESEDWVKITEDTGIGSNVAARSMNVNHNPHIWGDSIKYIRDDQFIRMTMSNNNEGAQVDPPKFDVMDSKERSAEGINALGQPFKNWPTEGWRSLGGKYDFETAYAGGILK